MLDENGISDTIKCIDVMRADGTPIYPKGYFEQLRQADMLMAEISREKPKRANLLREKAMIESALRQRMCGKRWTLLQELYEINKALSEINKRGNKK